MSNDDLVERLREMAAYKYQTHTIHAPAVMNAAADALSATEKRIADLIESLRVIEMETREGGQWGLRDVHDFAQSVAVEIGLWPNR